MARFSTSSPQARSRRAVARWPSPRPATSKRAKIRAEREAEARIRAEEEAKIRAEQEALRKARRRSNPQPVVEMPVAEILKPADLARPVSETRVQPQSPARAHRPQHPPRAVVTPRTRKRKSAPSAAPSFVARSRASKLPSPPVEGRGRRRAPAKVLVSGDPDDDGTARGRSLSAMRRRQEKFRRSQMQEVREKITREVVLPETITSRNSRSACPSARSRSSSS